MDELKPCPFCGLAPKLNKSNASDERSGYNFTVAIICACGACIKKPSHKGRGGWCDDSGEAKAEVISAWNRRAPEEPE